MSELQPAHLTSQKLTTQNSAIWYNLCAATCTHNANALAMHDMSTSCINQAICLRRACTAKLPGSATLHVAALK